MNRTKIYYAKVTKVEEDLESNSSTVVFNHGSYHFMSGLLGSLEGKIVGVDTHGALWVKGITNGT